MPTWVVTWSPSPTDHQPSLPSPSGGRNAMRRRLIAITLGRLGVPGRAHRPLPRRRLPRRPLPARPARPPRPTRAPRRRRRRCRPAGSCSIGSGPDGGRALLHDQDRRYGRDGRLRGARLRLRPPVGRRQADPHHRGHRAWDVVAADDEPGRERRGRDRPADRDAEPLHRGIELGRTRPRLPGHGRDRSGQRRLCRSPRPTCPTRDS